MKPAVRGYALPSHISREPGMAQALRLCGIDEYVPSRPVSLPG